MQLDAEVTEIERGIEGAVARIGKRRSDRLADEVKRRLPPTPRVHIVPLEDE
jgi:hypothetical protein